MGGGQLFAGYRLVEFFQTVGSDAAGDATADDAMPGEVGATAVSHTAGECREIYLDQLIPGGYSSEDAFARYEAKLNATHSASAEVGEIYDRMQDEFGRGAVNAELDGEAIRLAGFVAPLGYDGDLITVFLLVPYASSASEPTIVVTLEDGDGRWDRVRRGMGANLGDRHA